MRKLWFFLLMAAVLLSACSQGGGQSNAAPTPTKAAATAPTVDPKAPKMECKVEVSLVDATPDADLLAKFPPKLEGDWTKGGEQATLKIIEYSDYM